MMLSFYVATHITPLENWDYEGLRTLKVKIFKHWNGKIKSKGMRLCFHVSTHIVVCWYAGMLVDVGYAGMLDVLEYASMLICFSKWGM